MYLTPLSDLVPPVSCDNTILSDWCKCRRYALWRHGHHLTMNVPKAALAYGGAIHEALAAYHTGKPFKEVLDAFIKAWTDSGVEGDEKRNATRGCQLLVAYAKHYDNQPLKVMTTGKGAELSFTLPLGPFNYSGKIDLPALVDPYGIIVVDHKTTSVMGPDFFRMLNPNTQFTGYIWAARQYFDDVWGAMVNAIFVSAPTKADPENFRFQRQVTSRAEADMVQWELAAEKYMSELYAEFDKGNDALWPQSTVNCSYFGMCPYHMLCNMGVDFREIEPPDSHYMVEPWEPWKSEE